MTATAAHGDSADDGARALPSLRLPLGAAAALVLATLVGAAAVRLSGHSIREPDAAPIAQRELRFEDRTDGSIAVLDARSGALVDTVRGEAGFVRGTLRAMARERRRAGLGTAPAFRLVAHVDGRLTLLDPSNGTRIDLESFGPTNAAEFGRLLAPAPAHDERSPR